MTLKSKKLNYVDLDAAITVAIVKHGPIVFTNLLHHVLTQASALAEQLRGKEAGRADDKPAWRFVDNRLQALRKAGRIRYQREPEGWVLTD